MVLEACHQSQRPGCAGASGAVVVVVLGSVMNEVDDAEFSRALACVAYPSGVTIKILQVMSRTCRGSLWFDRCEWWMEASAAAGDRRRSLALSLSIWTVLVRVAESGV